MDNKTILRHYLSTLAFRATYALQNTQTNFPDFSAGNGIRTPSEILLHINHCLICANEILNKNEFSHVMIEGWDNRISALFKNIKELDTTITNIVNFNEKELLMVFQGPICDALNHIGQLMMLRRLSGDSLVGYEFDQEESIKIGKFNYDI